MISQLLFTPWQTLTRTILRRIAPNAVHLPIQLLSLAFVRPRVTSRERENESESERDTRACATHASQQRLALFYPPRTRHLSFFSSVAHPSSLSLSLVWFFPSLPPHPCSVTLFASHGREGQVETLGITKGPVVPLCISIECGRLSWFLSTWGPEPRPASMANKGSNAWRLEIFPPPSCSFHSQLDPHPFSVSLLLLPSSWCSLRRKEPGARLTALLRFPRAHYRARFMPLCSHLSLSPSSSLHAPEEKRRPSFSSSWKIVDMETGIPSFRIEDTKNKILLSLVHNVFLHTYGQFCSSLKRVRERERKIKHWICVVTIIIS